MTTLSLHPIRSTMALSISTLCKTLFSVLAPHRKRALENPALRQQIVVLQCSVKRPRLRKPDSVVRWHRKGFRLYWTWRSRRSGAARME